MISARKLRGNISIAYKFQLNQNEASAVVNTKLVQFILASLVLPNVVKRNMLVQDDGENCSAVHQEADHYEHQSRMLQNAPEVVLPAKVRGL